MVATATVVGATIIEAGNVFAASPYVRRDVGTLSASNSTITSYKKAIAAMKALPASNPLSWTYQAAIHGTTQSGSFPAWNTCEHGTYFFFSWHRMYLWYFERIVRKLSGDANWALPYWNYESASQRRLPAVFRSPASASNPLYIANRGAGWNSGSSMLNASAVDINVAFAEVPFNNFSNSLEGTPHGAVHVSIGGLMGSVPTAAQDPIFWLHHCNIDRLWNSWLAQQGGRTDPLADATWKNTKFLFFDENGKKVQLSGCDILRAQQQLNYVYQGEPTQVKLFCEKIKPSTPLASKNVLLRLPLQQAIVLSSGSDPVSVDLDIRPQRERLSSAANNNDSDLTLDFGDIEADRQPNVYYEVYAGLPKGAKPEFGSPFYIGNIALFGQGVRDEHHRVGFRSANFSFKVNRAVAMALRQNTNAGQLNILFVPRGPSQSLQVEAARSAANIRIGSISIGVQPKIK